MSPLDDDLEAVAQPDESDRLRGRLANAEADANRLRSSLATIERENEALRQVADFSTRPLAPPHWLKPPKRGAGHRATICAQLSDTHYTEVVNPDELSGFNAFNMEIAEQRLERFFQGIIKFSRQYTAGVGFDGAVLFAGGDLLTGTIHDLAETNEDTQMGGALRWTECIAAGIGMLADEFKKVHVPWTVGNHGRFTFRERTKQRVRDNTDWLIGRMLLREFDKDERVTFQIPEDIDVPVDVYDYRYLMNHGQAGGGGGIGGIWPPIMRLKARKMVHQAFRMMLLGHWHQTIWAPDQGLGVNGSLKGFDEFAKVMAFAPEPPQQNFWLSTPERGPTLFAPIFVADRKAEGW